MNDSWRKLRNHFLTGLLVMGPLFLSLVFISWLVKLTDHFVVDPLFQILPLALDRTFKIFLAKIALGLLVLCLVCLVGIAAERFVFKKLFLNWEGFLKSIPFFNNIYSSIREIIQAFFGDKKGVFRKVVFVEYPRKGIFALGFVTQDKRWDICDKTGKDTLSVYVPHPPNPATGFLVFVDKQELIDADMTVEEGFKLVISGGAAVPSLKKTNKN